MLALAVMVAVGLGSPTARSLLTPDAGSLDEVAPVVSEWQRERLGSPPPIDERVVSSTVAQVAAHPARFQDRLVRVEGRLSGLREEDRDLALSLVHGDEAISGLYPAHRDDLAVGQMISAVGLVSPSGTEMVILALSPETQERADDLLGLAWRTLFVAAGFLGAALLARVRRGIDSARRRKAVLAAALVGMLVTGTVLVGCDVGIVTTVGHDGSGSVVTEVGIGEEQMQEILGLPNSRATVDSWIAELEGQGVTVARGDGTLRITRLFESCAEFNSVPHRPGESWSYLQSIEMGDGTHFVYAGLLETDGLHVRQGVYDEDGQVFEDMQSRTRDVSLTSRVVLPGALLGARGGAGEWLVGLGESDRLFAESVVRSSSRVETLAPEIVDVWRAGLDWGLGAALGVLSFGLCSYPWRARGSR